jgi:LysM repeat protein
LERVDSDTYKVESGDTFEGLDKKMGYEKGTLQKLNSGVTPSKLQVGQEIITPTVAGGFENHDSGYTTTATAEGYTSKDEAGGKLSVFRGYTSGGNEYVSGDASYEVGAIKGRIGSSSSHNGAEVIIEGSATLFEAKGSAMFMKTIGVEAEGKAFTAEAKANGGLFNGKDSKYGADLELGAGAAVLKGDVAGVLKNPNVGEIKGKVGGTLVSAHIGGGARFVYDQKKGVLDFKGQFDIGLGVGIDIEIETTIEVKKISDQAERLSDYIINLW